MKVLRVSTPLRPNAQPLKPSAQPLKPSCCQPWDPANVKDSVSFGKSVAATVDVANVAAQRFTKYWNKVVGSSYVDTIQDMEATRLVSKAKVDQKSANQIKELLTNGLKKSQPSDVQSRARMFLGLLSN